MPRGSNCVLLLIYATLFMSGAPVSVCQVLVSAFTIHNSGTTRGGKGRNKMASSAESSANANCQDAINGDITNTSCPRPQHAFGRFKIDSSQMFYRSPSNLSAAIVNLRPIVPGHVLVISTRVVPLLRDLTDDEYCDLWLTVRKVQDMLAKKYGRSRGDDGDDDDYDDGSNSSSCSFNVAVQDGCSAGQSVPHVHVHILPRCDGDFQRNDDVYDELEAWAPRIEESAAKRERGRQLEVLNDVDRVDRTMEQMKAEADGYRELLKK